MLKIYLGGNRKLKLKVTERNGETGRGRERDTHTQTDRQTDRLTDRETEKEK